MGLFDRFTSKKGKDQTAGPKRGVVKKPKGKAKDVKETADKKAFAAVPSGQKEEVPKAVEGKKAVATTPSTAMSSSTAHFAQGVLVRAIVTEKSARGGSQSQYTFEVATTASKADVRRAVRHLYGVTPVSVNVLTMRGKVVRFGRNYGRTAKGKKAIVTLPAGKTIDVVSA